MLAGDPALRALLAELAGLQSDVDGALGQLDAATASAADLPRREAAVRRVGRALMAAQAKPQERRVAADEPPPHRFRPAWWAYPIAAAAALIAGLVLLTDRSSLRLPPPPDGGLNETVAIAPGPQIFETAQDPSIDRIERAEQEFLHPEPDLFTFDTTDLDR
jgi:hypothetical protein